MGISNNRVSATRNEQVFRFVIRDAAMTRATATIHAENLDVALNRLYTLFPGSDLSETEVEHTGQRRSNELQSINGVATPRSKAVWDCLSTKFKSSNGLYSKPDQLAGFVQ